MTIYMREVGLLFHVYVRHCDGSLEYLGKFRNPKHWY